MDAIEIMSGDSFGLRLRWVRKNNSLNLSELGKRIGFDKSYISRLERGHADNPSTDFIRKVCEVFEVNEVWLRDGEGSPGGSANLQNAFQRHLQTLDKKSLLELLQHVSAASQGAPEFITKFYRLLEFTLLDEIRRRIHAPVEDEIDEGNGGYTPKP